MWISFLPEVKLLCMQFIWIISVIFQIGTDSTSRTSKSTETKQYWEPTCYHYIWGKFYNTIVWWKTNLSSPCLLLGYFFIFQTVRYLQDTLCSKLSAEIIHNFLKALEPFKLMKAEKVMLLNNPPTTPLEIQLVCIHFTS